jgi:transcriptional regulator with XRE-family HTH domain
MLTSELRKAFGLRLRALRKQHHWTLKELASQINLLASQLNKYECGINWPPADKIVEIAALFHVSVDYLLIGAAQDQQPLHNQRLLERFRLLENFPSELQDIVIKLIDALIFKQQVQGALHSLDLGPTAALSTSNSAKTAPSTKNNKKKIDTALKSSKAKKSNPSL